MNFNEQRIVRVVVISLLIFILISTHCVVPCHGWHKTLTFLQQSNYESNFNSYNQTSISNMKFLMWHNDTYAVYGARDALILLRPESNSTIESNIYHWPIDHITMDECLQEWNTKDKCYNDIVHVRVLPESTKMDVYCTYAHRPMIRTFDLLTMSFIDDHVPKRDSHPPMDSESSYVMLNFNTNIITAGYQGDYIPTIRATQGRTLLYALRQNSYFISGFQYHGKAVFGVIETSDRSETNRVSRLVMACANRTEILRKAILNCSTDMFDQSRSFVFHILTALVDPIRMSNGSTLLFASFTTNNASITASAVCLFILDRQFYDVFTAPSKQATRRTTVINSELNDLIINCSQTPSSTIDRDMVESERQFVSYLSNPLLIETMVLYKFTAMNVIPYDIDQYCLIIGTSDGRLLTAFTNKTFQTDVFEELTLPTSMRHPIKSITYQKRNDKSYAMIITNQLGYLVIKLLPCNDKLCFECWTIDCSIEKKLPADTIIDHHRPSNNSIRLIAQNETDESTTIMTMTTTNTSNNDTQPLAFDGSLTSFTGGEQSNNKLLLFYIIIPMSIVIFILSISIIFLLIKSQRRRELLRRNEHLRNQHLSSGTTCDTLSKRNSIKSTLFENKIQSDLYPIKSNSSFRSLNCRVYSSSSCSLPSVVLSAPSPPLPIIPSSTPQFLSVHRLYKSYV